MENTELTHHGILGMKWGVRRYQNKDGSLTEAGKKRYDDDKELTKEEYEEAKAKAIKSGSATEVLKFKGDLTANELQNAYNRINWENQLKTLSDKELAPGKSKVEKFFDGVGKATTYATKAIQAYNVAANVINAFSDRDVDLPTIKTKITEDNKDLRNKQKKAKKEESKSTDDDTNKTQDKQQSKEAKTEERTEKVKAEKVTVSDSPNKKDKTETNSEKVVYDTVFKNGTYVSEVDPDYYSEGKEVASSLLSTYVKFEDID